MIFEKPKASTLHAFRTRKLRSHHSMKHDPMVERICVGVVNKLLLLISVWFSVCERCDILSSDTAGCCR